jgi:hypothetical protein
MQKKRGFEKNVNFEESSYISHKHLQIFHSNQLLSKNDQKQSWNN